MSIKKHIPNVLTTIRLGMAFALPFVFFNTTLLNTLIFYLAADVTDAFDGFLARKWKVQSEYGRKIDPIADKMLNGLALVLTSVFVNPLMLVLTGFEALIAGANLMRLKKGADVKVSQIGRVKTVSLFFAIVSSMLVPMVPSLSIASKVLIGLTAGLQAITAGKYIKEYHDENKTKTSKESVNNVDPKTPDEEVEKLKYLKKRLNVLSNNKVVSDKQQPSDVIENDSFIFEDTPYDDEIGMTKTLRK